MKLIKAAFACVLLAVLSACTEPAVTATSSPVSAPSQDAVIGSISDAATVLVQATAGKNADNVEPTILAAGQSMSGVIGVRKQGRILAFDVQIGNYQNTSDGRLAVKLCDGNMCSGGSASISNSADNQYLEIPLDHSLDTTVGRPLTYTLTRTIGAYTLAVWTYHDPATTTAMPDGTNQQRVPKIGLRYQGGSVLKLALEITAILLVLCWLAIKKLEFRTLVAAGMVLAAGLILGMVIVSSDQTSVHPDEFSHVAAYDYYAHHLLPPAINDPATIPSTSVWGFSYLFELDVVYDIAARLTGQVRQWTMNEVLAGRLFQFGLWSILCILAMCRSRWATVLCVILLTPQAWYVFSYFNADAFPLFLALIAAGLISNERSGLNEFMRSGNMKPATLWIAILCVGLILVSKGNYLPLVPAFILWLAVQHLNLRASFAGLIIAGLLALGSAHMLEGVLGSTPVFANWYLPLVVLGCLLIAGTAAFLCLRWWNDMQARRIMFRLAGFVLMCIVVASPRIAWDVHVNGWPAEKAASIRSVEEIRAGHDFKPSTIAQNKGYPTIRLAQRGASLKEVAFAPYHWASISLESAFGVYGYMNIFGPDWLYYALYGIAGTFVLLAFYSTWHSSPRRGLAFATVVIGGSTLVLASSLLLSWVSTFQPQGRYLLPILPLIALLLGGTIHGWRKRVCALLIGAAIMLSAYSFSFIALPKFI